MTKSFSNNALQTLEANAARKERSNEPEISALQTLEETIGGYTKKRNHGETTLLARGVGSLEDFRCIESAPEHHAFILILLLMRASDTSLGLLVYPILSDGPTQPFGA